MIKYAHTWQSQMVGMLIYFEQVYSLMRNLGIFVSYILTSFPSLREQHYLPVFHLKRNVLLTSLIWMCVRNVPVCRQDYGGP